MKGVVVDLVIFKTGSSGQATWRKPSFALRSRIHGLGFSDRVAAAGPGI